MPRKWWVNNTGTLTWRSIESWLQLALMVPSQQAVAHSGSYSFMFCGRSPANMAPKGAIQGDTSLAKPAPIPPRSSCQETT